MTDACKNPGNCSVIVVEDDVALRMVLSMQLEVTAINFCAASNGHQALALIRTHHPKVLLLDIAMPGLSGFQVMDAVKQDPNLLDLKDMELIVHSSLELSVEERQRIAFGHTQFLTKTKVSKELSEIISTALSADKK